MSSTAQQLRRLRSHFLLAALLPQAACGAGWHRIQPVAPSSLPKRQQVQVWQGGRPLQLHAVRLTDDSISGVPHVRPPDCDSCRVGVPSASVDSLRAGNPSAGFWKTTGLVIGGMVVLAAIGCASTDTACSND
jgi:hypothetical protein